MASSTRDRAVRAAILILGTEGVRALTHRRVDAEAGLPAGSTSNSFRTRAALLQGVVQQMVEEELPQLGVDDPRSAAELAGRLTGMFEFLVGPNRATTAARLALFVEAGHEPALRESLAGGRARFDTVLRRWFEAVGARDPESGAQLVAVAIQGLLLHEIGGHAAIDHEWVIGEVVALAAAPT